jgi:hypothetical protein
LTRTRFACYATESELTGEVGLLRRYVPACRARVTIADAADAADAADERSL